MKVKNIPNTWLLEEGYRLSATPHMSEARAAKKLLQSLHLKKNLLLQLTKGETKGILNGPRFARNYVESANHGVPLLSGSTILQADISDAPLISKRQAASMPEIILEEGTTLITSYGTVGRVAYTRKDMEGAVGSDNVMKVYPDPSKIWPGYLYTFLSSRFGVPIVTVGTSGGTVPFLTPERVYEIPVPRFDSEFEEKIHNLIQKASKLRVEASTDLRKAEIDLMSELGFPDDFKVQNRVHLGNQVSSSTLLETYRLEGFYYNQEALSVENWVDSYSNQYWNLEEVAHVFDVPPFKHIYVGQEEGVPFFTSGDLFKLNKEVDKYLSRTQTKNLEKYILQKEWVLLARSGQLGGIIGKPQFSDSAMQGAAASDHVIRILPDKKKIKPGYLYTYLASQKIGYPLITRTMTGASIPALWPVYLNKVKVVKASDDFMSMVDILVQAAFEKRVQATQIEREAREMLESAIEAAA